MSDIKNKIFKSSLEHKEILLLLDKKKIGYNSNKIVELHALLGEIKEDDIEYIKKYRNFCKQAESHNKYNFYNEKYKPLELSTLLGISLKKSFPFAISRISKFSNYDVFGYYMMFGFEMDYLVSLSPLMIKFTKEQNILLNKDLSGEWVINAGPGTGKTTVANARSYLMKDEGVLLISYTNDAINENYDRLKLYPGMKGILKKRNYIKDKNCICVTTVDSFAYYLSKIHNKSNGLDIDVKYYNSYDKVISYSNKNMKDICKLKDVKKYKHIIVDECQDIDDQRGNVIFNYYKHSNATSLCLFGDPRQQLHENRGNWYKKKWINYKYYNIGNIPTEFNKLGFCITHRFCNIKCLDITNKLSEKRPDLHVKLFSSFENSQNSENSLNNYGVIDVAINKSSFDENISLVAKYIIYLRFNCGINYSEMAVIGPSLDKQNKTSSLAGKILSVFTKYSIPCYTKSEGAFLPNAIFFTTIHGCKGKEYDYVFLYGCDGFPDTFKMIPNEISDSLIFVMHTRERKKIIYLSTKNTFVPPRGLRDPQSKLFFSKPELIVNQITDKDINENYDYRISDLSKEHNFQKFLSTNGIYIEFENLGYLDVCLPDLDDINKQLHEYKVLGKSTKTKVLDDWDSYLPTNKSITNKEFEIKKKYISPRFWGILNGFAIESYMYRGYPSILQKFVNKKYTILSDDKYQKFKKNGTIFNGIDRNTTNLIITKDTINTLSTDDIFRCKNLLTKNPKDINTSDMFFLSQCYDYFISGNTLSKNEYIDDNIDLKPKWTYISKRIIQYLGPCLKIEKFCSLVFGENSTVKHSAIGCIDSLHQKDPKTSQEKNFIVEFKTVNRDLTFSDAIQVLCYSICQIDNFRTTPLPILINLQKGSIVSPCLKRRLPPSSFNYSNFGKDLFSCSIKNTQTTVSYFFWTYIFTYFCRLKKHIEELISRKNQKQITSKYYSDTFFIDTEFATIYTNNKIQRYPFDIAIINGADPYKSIVSTLNWNNQQIYKQSVEWLSLPKELFQTSIDINTLRFYFHELLSEMGIDKPKLCYYICPTDVEWWNTSKDLKIDLGPITRKISQQKGFISGGKPPRLSEFYDISCYPSDFQPYLQVHTAMSDALMLYEMVQMDIISIDTNKTYL